MKKFFMLLAMTITIFSCTSGPQVAVKQDNFLEFQPVPPFPYRHKGEAQNECITLKEQKKCCPLSTKDEAQKKCLFPNISSSVILSKMNEKGEISYMVASVSGESDTYTVVMDYMAYSIERIMIDKGGNKEEEGFAKVGVGVRVTANIKTTERGVNVGDLLNLGFAAKQSKLSGSLLVDIVGISSPDITNLVPMTANIDSTSIAVILQGIGAIKSKIFDKETLVIPQVLAVKPNKSETGNINKLLKSLK
ncbi:MAG: hypothetical protein NTY22_01260 [Proteobacteria bacterium]|nr:hypothetical protein [Pseudomonadota bacterium]